MTIRYLVTTYSVFVADTLRDVDLWYFDFRQLSYMAGHVVNP